MNTRHLPSGLRRTGIVVLAASAAVLAVAVPAAAHSEVSASDARALATNVTLNFESEAESASAGFTQILIVLPPGVAFDAVRLKEAPKGWKLAAAANGYTVSGPALAQGRNAEHSIVVRQLPDAKSLAFKTVETYSDGKVSRWIEVPTAGQQEPDNPAPVLKLKAAAAGATPISPSPSPSPSPSASSVPSTLPSASPSPSSPASADESPVADEVTQSSDGAKGIGVVAAIVGAAVIVLVAAGLWVKRRGGGTEA